jgi:hypothetical protein
MLLRERDRRIGVSKTLVCPRTEFSRERRCFLGSEEFTPIAHKQTSVQTLLYLDMGPGIAGLVGFREQLQGAPAVPHCVILRHASYLLDAEHAIYVQAFRYFTIGRPRLGRRHAESLVEVD